jgi:sterol 3beta-glucosyltransferase
MAGLHIAEALRIPYFAAFTMPWSRTKVYPHPFAVLDKSLGAGYNYVSHVLIEQILWKGSAPLINKWRKRTLGRPSTGFNTVGDLKLPFLYNFSETIVPHPSDWNNSIRIWYYPLVYA